jgi:hypothetical protein
MGATMPLLRQGADEGCGHPVLVRNRGAQPLTTRRTAVRARPAGKDPSFVDEHQFVRVQIGLAVEPALPPAQDIRALLLGGVRGLFLRVIRWRRKKRCNVP